MRTVVFTAPFPLDATLRFARGIRSLAGVRLVGAFQELPKAEDRAVFHDVVPVTDGLSVGALVDALRKVVARHGGIHRVVGILEPLQEVLAAARATLGIPGTTPEVAAVFRDKARMKDRLRAAGLPVARHRLLEGGPDARAFLAEVPFPWVMKPPAGMGAKATFRVRTAEEATAALEGLGARPDRPILAEEFLEGDEGSYDTVVVDGLIRGESISHYRPSPLTVLENPWVQWCCVLPRSLDAPAYARVADVGRRAIAVLGLRHGMTHMEWFKRRDGSIAIGEIAQRPPGANITRMLGLAHDIDPYRCWARAVVDETFEGSWRRGWSVGCAFLRGVARGRVAAVTGLEEVQKSVGAVVMEAKLPRVGAPKSDSYEGDGYVIVRARETDVVERALKVVIEGVRVHYA